MELLADNYEKLVLRDEIVWLQERLQAVEANCRLLVRQNKSLQCQLRQQQVLEVKAALREKERAWMTVSNQQMLSLLKIIQHQEIVNMQLQNELKIFKTNVTHAANTRTTTVTISTQTEHEQPIVAISEQQTSRYRSPPDKCPLHSKHQDPTAANLQELFHNLEVSASREKTKHIVSQSTAKRQMYYPTARNDHVPDFRASVMQRLSRSHYHSSSAAFIRPPMIPEEDMEEEDQEEPSQSKMSESAQEQHEKRTKEGVSPSLYYNLEEQNKLLQERLASQQQILDQLLHTKLQETTAISAVAISSPPRPDTTTNAIVGTFDRRDENMQDEDTGFESESCMLSNVLNPMSPPAA